MRSVTVENNEQGDCYHMRSRRYAVDKPVWPIGHERSFGFYSGAMKSYQKMVHKKDVIDPTLAVNPQ